MENLIIIGAGGMGRTFYDWVRECVGYGERFVIKGFIDDNIMKKYRIKYLIKF